MGDDTASRSGWGVVLEGERFDLDDWREAFKQPFGPLDPWVMEAKFGSILRSSRLDGEATASKVCERAKALMDEVNGAIRASYGAGVVRRGDIVEILSDGTLRRHVFAQLDEVLRIRLRSAVVRLDPDGKPYPEPPPEPSRPQRWLRIAAEDDLLADALTYFARCDDWFDVYKALECLIQRFAGGEKDGQVERFRRLGWANADEITRLRKTANSKRHARGSFDPPARPMEHTEARHLLATLMASAFREAPTTPQPALEQGKGRRKAQRKARAVTGASR
jgi:hypothetical protein